MKLEVVSMLGVVAYILQVAGASTWESCLWSGERECCWVLCVCVRNGQGGRDIQDGFD